MDRPVVALADLALLARRGVVHSDPAVFDRAGDERVALPRVERCGARSVVELVSKIWESTAGRAGSALGERQGRRARRTTPTR